MPRLQGAGIRKMTENKAPELKPVILQCKGKIGLNERQSLESLGVSLNEYIPENAFLVRVSQEQLEAVNKLPFIESASPLGLENKMVGEAVLNLAGVSTDQSRERIRVVVKFFENAEADSIIKNILKDGGKVTGHDSQWIEVELEARFLTELASFPEVLLVEEVKDYELLNDRAGEIVKAPSLWTGGLTGAGQIIGIADTGLDTGIAETMHPDFKNRITAVYSLGRNGDASDFHGHGTHVAGSALGAGTASEGRYRGLAPESSLVFQSIMDKNGGLSGIPGDLGILLAQAYNAGARVYNISWGSSVSGAYNYTAAQVDKFVWEHDDMAIAVAAGNIGQVGAIYSPAVAKNVIAVGASENNRPERGSISDNPSEMAHFSSRGPAADGRVKPDVVAPGTWILSTRSSLAPENRFWGVENQYYAYNGGTSMSSPIVAGMLALIREYFTRVRGINPSSALLKAALFDGAFQLPNYSRNEEGHGRINAPEELLDPARNFFYADRETKLATGEKKTYEYRLSGPGSLLKVTLVWTDYPGATTTSSKSLVNDLDLVVEDPAGQVYTLDDHMNNVEQIVIPNAVAGTYKITVNGYSVPMGYQGYALFVSGGLIGQADSIAPVVHITNPRNNSNVIGIVNISAEATDNVAVTKAEFFLDSQLVYTDTTPPYELVLDTRTFTNKTYTLTARAYDEAGNAGQDSIVINVNNTVKVPEVKITWPLDGVVLKGVTRFRVNVSSDQPLANVYFLVDDEVIKVYDYSKTIVPIKRISPYTTFDTMKYPNGSLTIKARACDSGRQCGEASVFVTVSNP